MKNTILFMLIAMSVSAVAAQSAGYMVPDATISDIDAELDALKEIGVVDSREDKKAVRMALKHIRADLKSIGQAIKGLKFPKVKKAEAEAEVEQEEEARSLISGNLTAEPHAVLDQETYIKRNKCMGAFRMPWNWGDMNNEAQ